MPLDYHKVLGLNPDANEDQIKKRYRKLALIHHPDKNPDPKSQERFILITEAYQRLLNPDDFNNSGRNTQSKQAESSPESFEERLKRAQAYAEYTRQKEANEVGRFKQSNIAKISRVASVIYLLIGMFICVDYGISKEGSYLVDQYKRDDHYIDMVHMKLSSLDGTKHRKISMSFGRIMHNSVHRKVDLKESKFTGVVHDATFTTTHGKKITVDNERSIYKAIIMMIFVFFSPFITLFFNIKKGFYYGLVYARIFFPLICLILMISIHLSY